MCIGWTEFLDQLKGRSPSLTAFAFEWWQYNTPMLEQIRKIVPPPARILEVGAGTGALSIFLAANGYKVLGIDINERVIDGAEKFAEYLRVPCEFQVGDGFRLDTFEGKFDLAFSAGVIEHFSSDDAATMLREKGKAAKYVLAVVPTGYALRNDPLTEASGARAIPQKELRRLFLKADLQVIKEFGYGTPDGRFSIIYRYLLPHIGQLFMQNYFSYACTIGCLGNSRAKESSFGH